MDELIATAKSLGAVTLDVRLRDDGTVYACAVCACPSCGTKITGPGMESFGATATEALQILVAGLKQRAASLPANNGA